MTIEVTSVPGRRRPLSLRRSARAFDQFRKKAGRLSRRILFQVLAALLVIATIAACDALLRSYQYYSKLIEARLSGGYLNSRPGLYAAPRTIRVGSGFSVHDLVNVLRRAGYVEKGSNSEVWSGSFSKNDSAVEIQPRLTARASQPRMVQVSVEGGRISALKGDGISLDSFTLEPEILTNELSSKAGLRNTLTYPDIPPVLVHAILAIEDHRFFEHPGMDIFGVARALLRNLGDTRMAQGGSTITQQLVKNTYLSPERTFRRKYSEAMLAFALDRRLSKEDIFALYCNEVYLGQRGAVAARGVEQAAAIYFGKELKQVSLSEAATIAGMIQGPSRYSPERHREATRARRNAVLAAMARDGWISAELANTTSSERVTIVETDHHQALAPYYIDYVSRVAEAELDVSGETQRIYTTIDLDLQRLAEAAINQQLDRLNDAYKGRTGRPQAALVALDPRTGNVLAMVGGRNYGESQLNRATDALRQPGSTFKPFVYAAALEDGLSPVHMFTDAPREFVYDRNRSYRPANFGGSYSMREVTMCTGLVKSLNVVTVAVAMRTGLARIANLAAEFGMTRPARYPALALGTAEVTPLQLAASYAAFVNGGRRVEPKVIASVTEPPGSHTMSGDGPQVISPTTAYMITNMLSAVIDHGTARAARGVVRGTAIAGKTGTSRDGWFVGYTPNLVCVVWIGFDDNSQLGLTGAAAALPAWTDFVRGAVELRPELGGRSFECPEGIKFVEIDAESGLLSTLSCPNRELIAVTDRLAPNFECYNHGNLPYSNDWMEGNPGPIVQSAVVASQRKPPSKESLLFQHLTSKSTRVDVDSRGRHALVNDLR
ncbi:MAG: transglycosylase domain-containing protein [Pyrinomonadaceae bacterium]